MRSMAVMASVVAELAIPLGTTGGAPLLILMWQRNYKGKTKSILEIPGANNFFDTQILHEIKIGYLGAPKKPF